MKEDSLNDCKDLISLDIKRYVNLITHAHLYLKHRGGSARNRNNICEQIRSYNNEYNNEYNNY